MTDLISLSQRYQGALVGLAAGDALGTTLEFAQPGTFKPISDMEGGGVFGLKPGQWTDDTSMALCLAESLVLCQGFDPWDQMERYVRWWREGYMSSTGTCFDIGKQTRGALAWFEACGDPYQLGGDRKRSGNGSLMRLAPVVLAYRGDPKMCIHAARRSSVTTHSGDAAADACRVYAAMLLSALNGLSKEQILDPARVKATPGVHTPQAEILEVVEGSYRHRNPPDIRGEGYVVRSLEAALWAFWHATSFEEGALLAANLGLDADTTAAIYGQLAGAHFGHNAIPASWRAKLHWHDRLVGFADALLTLSERGPKPLPPQGRARPSQAKPIVSAPMIHVDSAHVHGFEDVFDLDAIRRAWAAHGDTL